MNLSGMAASSCALLLSGALSLSAQPVPASGSVQGVVRNSVTGEPVRKAEVRLSGRDPESREASRNVVTDSGGSFYLRGLPAGTYVITTSHRLFSRTENSYRMFQIEAGSEAVELDFELSPTAVVSGRVVDEEGDPRYGIQVGVMASGPEIGRHHDFIRSVQTDDRGRFRLWGVPRGSHYLFVGAENEARLRRTKRSPHADPLQEVYPRSYFPGVLDIQQAERITVKPGEERSGLELRHRRYPAVSVRGRVVPVSGEKWKQVAIGLERAGPRNGRSSTSLNEPAFEFMGVLPGKYVVEVTLNHHFGKGDARYGRVRVTVTEGDVDGVTVQLRKPLAIAGTITVDGDPQRLPELLGQAAHPRHPNRKPSVLVRFAPEDGVDWIGSGRIGGRVGPDGAFATEKLPPNRYRIDVIPHSQFGYIKSARMGLLDVAEDGLDLETASPTEPLIIDLATDYGSVEVTPLNVPDGASQIIGVLAPVNRQRIDLYTSGIPGPATRFPKVPPGSYSLFVFAGKPERNWDNPEFLAQFERQAIEITVKPNQPLTVQAEAISLVEERQ